LQGFRQRRKNPFLSQDGQGEEIFSVRYLSSLGSLRILGRGSSILGVEFSEVEVPNAQDAVPEILLVCRSQLDEYFRGKRKAFALELEPRGTPFQQRVWKELLRIPYGETRSYKAVARKIGNGQAARAVGTANARNPISIVIPCHRVLGSRGELVGYGGELWRKKWLLDHERRLTSVMGV